MVNIKQLLKDKGISQLELSRLLNEHTSVVSLMVNGKREVADVHLRKLEEIFGVDEIAKYDGLTDEDIAERQVRIDIKALIVDYNITQTDIAGIINEPQSVVSTLANGKRQPMKRHIDALVAHFGKEVIDSYTLPAEPFEGISKDVQLTIIDPETVQEMRKEVREEIEEIESFPVLPEDVTTSPNTDVLKYVEENGSELETINPSQLLNDAKVDVAERIKRTSMLPTFQPEDTVFIRFIKDKIKIVDGETYYLDCKNRPTMIRLVKFEPDGKLRLIAKNSQYGDIIIDRCDIINIGVVVALFRMTFGDQYSELEALRRQKDAEREKKDTQIDKMLEMMQAQGEQQSKLIDFITKEK